MDRQTFYYEKEAKGCSYYTPIHCHFVVFSVSMFCVRDLQTANKMTRLIKVGGVSADPIFLFIPSTPLLFNGPLAMLLPDPAVRTRYSSEQGGLMTPSRVAANETPLNRGTASISSFMR